MLFVFSPSTLNNHHLLRNIILLLTDVYYSYVYICVETPKWQTNGFPSVQSSESCFIISASTHFPVLNRRAYVLQNCKTVEH